MEENKQVASSETFYERANIDEHFEAERFTSDYCTKNSIQERVVTDDLDLYTDDAMSIYKAKLVSLVFEREMKEKNGRSEAKG